MEGIVQVQGSAARQLGSWALRWQVLFWCWPWEAGMWLFHVASQDLRSLQA